MGSDNVQKWPAFCRKQAGTVEVSGDAVKFFCVSFATEIKISQLSIRPGGNYTFFNFCDKVDRTTVIAFESTEPVETLARRGLHEAKLVLAGIKKKRNTRIAMVVGGVFLTIMGAFVVPLIISSLGPFWFNTIFSYDSEEQIGISIVREVSTPLEVIGHPAQVQLQNLANRLASSDIEVGKLRPKIHYSMKKELSLVVLPGCNIVISRGLIESIETAPEITGILIHAFGHSELRHPARLLFSGLGISSGVSMLMNLAGARADSMRSSGPKLIAYRYPSNYESDVDAWAEQAFKNLKYEASGYKSFWAREILPAIQVLPIHEEFINSHPVWESRVEWINNNLPKLGGAPVGPDWLASLKETLKTGN
ncbi:MAG: M48 family metalloprotease [Bdellovibrionia bacterium]